jgi:hypothetical protein
LLLSAQAAPAVTSVAPPQPQPVAAQAANISTDELLSNAFHTAQTIYIYERGPGNYLYSDGFRAFYAGIQALGRYQLAPTTAGADLILHFDLENGMHVTVFDVRTNKMLAVENAPVLNVKAGTIIASLILPPIGGIVGSKNEKKEAESLVNMIKLQAGESKAAGSITTYPTPKRVPKSPSDKQVKSLMQGAHTILVVNKGVPSGFFVAPQIPFNQFKSDLAAWGRYKLVSSFTDADFIIEITGEGYVYTADVSHGDMLRIKVIDPKTLQIIWAAWDSPPIQKMNFKKIIYPVPVYADPEHDASVSVQNLVNYMRKEVGDPVIK